MENQEIFDFLAMNLSVKVLDASEPSSCGGEIEGSLGVKVQLYLFNPASGKKELISEDDTLIG
jgi:hypothetical protein